MFADAQPVRSPIRASGTTSWMRCAVFGNSKWIAVASPTADSVVTPSNSVA